MILGMNERQTREYMKQSGFLPVTLNGHTLRVRERLIYVIDDAIKTRQHYGDLCAYPSFVSIERPRMVALDSHDRWVLCYDGRTAYWALMNDGRGVLVKTSVKDEETKRFVTPANLLVR